MSFTRRAFVAGTAVVAAAAFLRLRRPRPTRVSIPPVGHDAERIRYGSDNEVQFGDLRLPSGSGPHPVVVVVHGGSWLASYDLELMTPLAEKVAAEGFATWNVEYRALGDEGGGWPGTFLDIAAALDHLREIAATRPLHLDRMTALGHSAGGQLGLWLAARPHLRAGVLGSRTPLPITRAVSLAGVLDLRRFADGGSLSVRRLLGGDPSAVPDRYAAVSPAELLPLGVPQVLIHGSEDRIVPPDMSERYAALARERGDTVTFVPLAGIGHFEPIEPDSAAWPHVLASLRG